MVKEILRRFRQTQIICLGFSMGANIVTRFLATPFMDLTDNKPAATAPDATSPAQAPSSGVDVATSKDQPVKISSVPEHPEEVDSARVIAGISVCQGYDAVT